MAAAAPTDVPVTQLPLAAEQRGWLERAWAQIDADRIAQLNLDLTNIPSPTGEERAIAEFLARFMKEIGVPKATLIGQSMGAGVALQMAVKYPQMLDRMVLVNGTPGLAVRDAGQVLSVIALTVDDGRITAIDIIRDPDKLTTLSGLL